MKEFALGAPHGDGCVCADCMERRREPQVRYVKKAYRIAVSQDLAEKIGQLGDSAMREMARQVSRQAQAMVAREFDVGKPKTQEASE